MFRMPGAGWLVRSANLWRNGIGPRLEECTGSHCWQKTTPCLFQITGEHISPLNTLRALDRFIHTVQSILSACPDWLCGLCVCVFYKEHQAVPSSVLQFPPGFVTSLDSPMPLHTALVASLVGNESSDIVTKVKITSSSSLLETSIHPSGSIRVICPVHSLQDLAWCPKSCC